MVVFFAVLPVLRAGEVFAVAFAVPAEDFAAAFVVPAVLVFVPEDFAAAVDLLPLDFVSVDFAAVDFVPLDLVAVDLVPVDFVAVDFVPEDFAAAVDLVPVDFVPEDFVPEDFVPEDLVPVDFAAVDLVPVDFVVDDLAVLDLAVLDLAVPALAVPDFAVVDLAVVDFVPVDFVPVDFAALDFVPDDPVVLFGAVFAAAPFAVVLLADVPRAVVVPPRAVVVRVRLVVVRVEVGRVADVRDDVCVPAAPRAVVADVRFAGVAFGSFLAPLTTSLNVVPARKAGTLVFFTRTVSPVRGFRAVRAARARFSNTPKPVMFTFSPLFTVRMMMSTRLSTASDATFLSPKRSESASMSWALLAIPVLQEELRVTRPHRPTCAHGITNAA